MRVLSLYIHVPFCTRRCSYCSFYHVQSIAEREARYVTALESEAAHTFESLELSRLRSVFVGGGTPSVLGSESLRRVFDLFRPYLHRETTEEITAELNPEDVTGDLVGFLCEQGVTRISLGIQSMDPIAQKVLKRCTPGENLRAIELIRRTFENVSFDVLIGVPGSSFEIFCETITTLSSIRPQHFSVYCLEPGGDMSHEVEKFFSAVDSDRAAREYLFTCEHLAAEGYEHYEMSNFALPGRASVHNRIYWGGGEYIGLGPGAHSYVSGRRYHNLPSLDDYLAHSGADREAARVYDDPQGVDSALERFMLGLRTSRGVPRGWCNCGDRELETLERDGLIMNSDGRVRASERGFLVLNDLILKLCAPPGPEAMG